MLFLKRASIVATMIKWNMKNSGVYEKNASEFLLCGFSYNIKMLYEKELSVLQFPNNRIKAE